MKDRKQTPEAAQPETAKVADTTEDQRYPQRNVKRDVSRGTDERFRKEVRDSEDAICNAGMRNPAAVLARWPTLAAAMVPVKKALVKAMEYDAELRDLPLAVGLHPVNRHPPRQP